MGNLITLSALSLSIMAIVGIAGGIVLSINYLKNKNDMLLYFAIFFYGLGVVGAFFTIGAIAVAGHSYWGQLFFLFGHVLLFFTLAVFMQLPAKLISPKSTKYILYIFIVLALIASFLVILNPLDNLRVENNLVMNTLYPANEIIIAVFDFITLIASGIVFIYFGFNSKDAVYKLRSFVFALGFLVLFSAGPSHSLSHTTLEYFMADIFTAIGMFIILVGMFIPKIASKTRGQLFAEKEK